MATFWHLWLCFASHLQEGWAHLEQQPDCQDDTSILQSHSRHRAAASVCRFGEEEFTFDNWNDGLYTTGDTPVNGCKWGHHKTESKSTAMSRLPLVPIKQFSPHVPTLPYPCPRGWQDQCPRVWERPGRWQNVLNGPHGCRRGSYSCHRLQCSRGQATPTQYSSSVLRYTARAGETGKLNPKFTNILTR